MNFPMKHRLDGFIGWSTTFLVLCAIGCVIGAIQVFLQLYNHSKHFKLNSFEYYVGILACCGNSIVGARSVATNYEECIQQMKGFFFKKPEMGPDIDSGKGEFTILTFMILSVTEFVLLYLTGKCVRSIWENFDYYLSAFEGQVPHSQPSPSPFSPNSPVEEKPDTKISETEKKNQ